MEKAEAVTAIKEKIVLIESDREFSDSLLTFSIEKLVTDIMAYCHITDFPDDLIYTAVDVIRKRMDGEDNGNEPPVSDVKMDDTEFKYAVSNVDTTRLMSDLYFDGIKSKLNQYRRVVSL